MARLLHLNGPPGVGKSSVARAYVADHPGVLGLDADTVVAMIGGWRDAFWETLPVARRLAAAMAREHLRADRDVVLPQLVTHGDEIAPYLAAVADAGATYVEVVLLADLPTTIDRFTGRKSTGRQVSDVVAESGGLDLLTTIRADLLRYLDGRTPYLSVDTTRLTPAETYRAVLSRLS